MSKKAPYKTADGKYTLPAGVSMREAMEMSKADAIIRLACALERSRKLSSALLQALGPMGVPPLAVVRGPGDEVTKIYQLGELVLILDEHTLLSFNSFEEAAKFCSILEADHNRQVYEQLQRIIAMQR